MGHHQRSYDHGRAASDPWLGLFEQHQQPMIRAWFAYAISQGANRPESLYAMVHRVVSAKLEWSVSPTSIQLCQIVLAALEGRKAEALRYAASLLQQGEPPDAA